MLYIRDMCTGNRILAQAGNHVVTVSGPYALQETMRKALQVLVEELEH
jgi:hypothetical protein